MGNYRVTNTLMYHNEEKLIMNSGFSLDGTHWPLAVKKFIQLWERQKDESFKCYCDLCGQHRACSNSSMCYKDIQSA